MQIPALDVPDLARHAWATRRPSNSMNAVLPLFSSPATLTETPFLPQIYLLASHFPHSIPSSHPIQPSHRSTHTFPNKNKQTCPSRASPLSSASVPQVVLATTCTMLAAAPKQLRRSLRVCLSSLSLVVSRHFNCHCWRSYATRCKSSSSQAMAVAFFVDDGIANECPR